jgi:hypothetical protein
MISPPAVGSRLPVGSSGDQQPRSATHRAGDADALLLARGQLPRQRFSRAPSPSLSQRDAHALGRSPPSAAGDQQRQGDVVEHAAIHQQAVVLVHHADLAPVQRDLAAAHLGEVAVSTSTVPRLGRSLRWISLQQRALAGAGMAGDEQHLAFVDAKSSAR